MVAQTGSERELSFNLRDYLGEDLFKQIAETDSAFDSYLIQDGNPICVRWKTKPFTIYIPSSRNKHDKLISIKYIDITFKLDYKGTLKENYCQRISNKSFAHPLRVGVTFASTKISN